MERLSKTTIFDIAFDSFNKDGDYSFIENINAIAAMPAESLQNDELQTLENKITAAINADDEEAVTTLAMALESYVLTTKVEDDETCQRLEEIAQQLIYYGLAKYHQKLGEGY